MSEQPAAGPPCDLCKEETAVMSVMNLADYSTLYIGPACVVTFYRAALAELEPAPAPPAPEPAPPGPELPEAAPPGGPGHEQPARPVRAAETRSGPRKPRAVS